MQDDPWIEFYFEGDRLGASAEGMPGSRLTAEEMLRRQGEHPEGTDESDLVRLFQRFVHAWDWTGDVESFAAAWAVFVTRHRRATRYGRTWRHLFHLVRYWTKTYDRPIGYGELVAVARDVNSCGNGCLALVYPAVRYAREVDADPYRLAGAVAEVSHAHPTAQRCVWALVHFFLDADDTCFTTECLPPSGEEERYTHLAPGCLWAAVQCAGAQTKHEAVQMAARIGGDVDSYLSLGLLLWGWQQDHKPGPLGPQQRNGGSIWAK